MNHLPPGFMEGGVIRGRLYHGSASPQDVLSPEYGSEYGIYLTPSRRYARSYGDVVHTVLTNVKRPLEVADKSEISPRDLTLADIQRLEAQGYDSIASLSGNGKIVELVVFRPENVHIMEKNPVSSVVYHRTWLHLLLDILKSNRFMPTSSSGTPADQLINKGYEYYFSLMRSPRGDYARSSGQVALIELDGRKLNQRFKGGPVDYWGPKWNKDEMEDRVFTNKPFIENAKSYITAIHVLDSPHTLKYFSPNDLAEIEEYSKGYDYPIYEYPTPEAFRMLNKRDRRLVSGRPRVSGPVFSSEYDIKYGPGSPARLAKVSEMQVMLEYFKSILAGDPLPYNTNSDIKTWHDKISYRYAPEERRHGGSEASSKILNVLGQNKANYKERPRLHELTRLIKKHGPSAQEFVELLHHTLWGEEGAGYNEWAQRTKNPLLNRPPQKYVKHRAGPGHTLQMQQLWGVEDMYEGVHVTSSPFAALAYALAHRLLGDNEWGLFDVILPPVLIGIGPLKDTLPDMDVYSVANSLVAASKNLSRLDLSEDDNWEAVEDEVNDNSHSGWFDSDDLSVRQIAGSVANRPSSKDFSNALGKMLQVREQMESDWDLDPEEEALKLALEILTQRRVLYDVPESKVVCLVIPGAYLPERGGYPLGRRELAELTGKFIDSPEGDADLKKWDKQALKDGTVVWGNLNKVVWWHGTGLQIAVEALPGILTPQLVREIENEASVWDEDELEDAMAEWEDDDED